MALSTSTKPGARSAAKPARLKAQLREAAKSSARTAILRAAEAAFVADGVAGTSMQSIAAKAGTSVGTLYNYFHDRDDLVRALFEDSRRHLRDAVDAAVDGVVSEAGGTEAGGSFFRPRLVALVRTVLTHFDEHRAFLAIALSTDLLGPMMAKRAHTGLLRDRIGAVVEVGVAEGTVDPTRAPLAVLALMGLLRAILFDGVDASGASFAARTDDVIALFLDGALRRVG